MLKLHDGIGPSDQTSNAFMNNDADYVTITAAGNWGDGSAAELKIQVSPDPSAISYYDLYQSGSLVKLTATANLRGMNIPGGLAVRVVETTSTPNTDLDIYVGGPGLVLL